MSKPTPGPWRQFETADLTMHVVRSEYQFVADCHSGDAAKWPSRSEREANARLIVASCNAIQAAAEILGEDPIRLAEWLGNDTLANIITNHGCRVSENDA